MKLEIKYNAFTPWQNFKVLETDYQSYAVVHSCTVSLGAWTYEDTQVLSKYPMAVNSRFWTKVNQIIPGVMKHKFTDKEKVQEMSSLGDKFEAVIQGAENCNYPDE